MPDSSDWEVIRKAGTEIRVPRKTKLSRTVGAQIPTGFDPTVWGITPDMANSIDRVALWNIVATVDAFLSSGFTPTELLRWVHPSLVASTQGTGMGGMTSMQTMYHGNLLGRAKPNDILQEVLPNVVAAHVMQSYVGGYGAMVHPVAACATVAVSVEEGVDKIRLGKAEFVVAGGFDDLTLEAIIGFGDMAATADTEMMRAKGISDSKFSRANDRRPPRVPGSPGRWHHPAGQRRAGGQDGIAGAGRGRLRTELRRRCAHLDPGARARRPRRRPRWQGLAAGPLAGQAGRGSRRHRGRVQARHLDAGQRPQRDRAARAVGRLDGPVAWQPAVRGEPEDPHRSQQGWRGSVPADGPVPDAA
ncbi:beta-ketoacyl synthase, N-terminal domain protein [Mycobacterium intracellulare 1956]|uniref:Beta-ketoacyl synthase, N-terminal domain protein n=1 Tax=Mycobacterium intracellulare 1956 TaxID=1299331 RepID=X8CSL7_MYCIT|nr:beta-ketoacyl synthase, N-terminal domain protein [Mycobacterium intracellulare 1956]